MIPDPQMYSEPPLESCIFKALRDEFPKPITAKQLMDDAGLSWRIAPVTSFVKLCISFSKLNQDLIGTGWQAERSGGTPDDVYMLSPSGGG